jgi:hypothetical protein
VRFVSCIAKEVSCLKDMILKKINDKGALLFALFILLAGEAAEQDNIGKMIMSFVVSRLLFLDVIYLLSEIYLLGLAWIFLLLKIMY